ncbi:hydroxysqualene dehydroxylase HpnE [Lichenicola sp.]|uniref:hydroxysqualene dehydroxylase HpnE n=1 Tax=Lichenicola sp. TaxID=2804529 RepID=UPI003AFF6AAC
MSGTVHIVGGGLAGLSAALELAEAGRRVTIYEGGPALGGRARSYEDKQLGCRLDNGNHLLLSANETVFAYLDRIGARHTLVGPGAPIFPFHDLAAGLDWTVRLSPGRIPWWVFSNRRGVPGMRLKELGGLLKLMRARGDQTVSECLDPGALADRLMIPLAVSALNTRPEIASAALMGAVMRESMAKGGSACVPWFPAIGLSESLVDPATVRLQQLGVTIRTGARVAGLGLVHGRVGTMLLPEGRVELAPGDQMILAVPAHSARDVAAGVLPDMTAPTEYESILNLHYRADVLDRLTGDLARAGFAGVVGGMAEWVFVKPGILSVTVSAANHLADHSAAALAATIWREVRAVVSPALQPGTTLPDALPPHRVVREKRATFAATPAQDRLRPQCRTSVPNLVLAGDWTATGLPATIEGAMRSGLVAARALGPGSRPPLT